MLLVLATTNKGKLREMKEITSGMGIEVKSAAEMGFSEDVPETGETFAENARIKALAVCKALGRAALADDSGLTVDALDGAPGVYSARYAGEQSDDAKNVAKLMEAMTGVPRHKRGAAFVCAVCLAKPDGALLETSGEMKGDITLEPHGHNGFGYDPVFRAAGRNRTNAELSPEEKNAISHRGEALRKLSAGMREFLGIE